MNLLPVDGMFVGDDAMVDTNDFFFGKKEMKGRDEQEN